MEAVGSWLFELALETVKKERERKNYFMVQNFITEISSYMFSNKLINFTDEIFISIDARK